MDAAYSNHGPRAGPFPRDFRVAAYLFGEHARKVQADAGDSPRGPPPPGLEGSWHMGLPTLTLLAAGFAVLILGGCMALLWKARRLSLALARHRSS